MTGSASEAESSSTPTDTQAQLNAPGSPTGSADSQVESPEGLQADGPEGLQDPFFKENTAPFDGKLTDVVGTRDPTGTHDQITRRVLAYSILGVVILINACMFGTYLWGSMTTSQLTTAIAALAGPQALAAAVVGFYYGSPTDSQ